MLGGSLVLDYRLSFLYMLDSDWFDILSTYYVLSMCYALRGRDPICHSSLCAQSLARYLAPSKCF